MTNSLPSIQAIDREIFYRKHESETLTGVLAEKFYYGETRISIVPKLRPIFEHNTDKYKDVEHFLMRGGRAGAKSESVGELLVFIARTQKTRILCTREIQNSIDDSVKKVIEDWIDFLGFRHEFDINNKKIRHKETGTDFVFLGLKSSTDTNSVKSLKGMKYVWVEEAQMLSEESRKMLTPTVRIDGRQFFYTYNRRTEHDVVDSIKRRKKAMMIEINYTDNPFLPKTSLEEAMEDKETDYDMYLNIWEGQPMAEDASSIILPYSHLKQCINLHLEHGFSEGQMFGGFDIADGQHNHNDKNSFAMRAGATLHECLEWRIGEVYQSVRKVHGYYGEMGFSELYFDAVGMGVAAKSEYARIIDEDSMRIPYDVVPIQGSMSPKGGEIDFVKHGSNVIKNKDYFKNVKSQLWWNIHLRLKNSMKLIQGHNIDRDGYYLSFSSKIKDLDSLFSELSQATYKLDGGGRRMIDKMPGVKEIQVEGKTKKIKSPNKADSTILSYAKDLEFGLRAHGDEPVEDEFKVEPVTEWSM